MSDAGRATQQALPVTEPERSSSEAAVAVALGFVALLVGLGATMAGTWIAYWHRSTLSILDGTIAAPGTDTVSLYLVVCGTVTTIFGGLSIYRSQDM